jgi:hypothetical protein
MSFMDMKTKLAGLMAQCLTDTWPDAQGLPTAEEIRGLLAVPPDPKMGDFQGQRALCVSQRTQQQRDG